MPITMSSSNPDEAHLKKKDRKEKNENKRSKKIILTHPFRIGHDQLIQDYVVCL